MHDGEEWEESGARDKGEKKLGGKRIGVEVALQVEKKLDGVVGNKEGMDGGEV